MENIKKKYCCITTHRLSLDSALRGLPLKDIVLDGEGYITLFSANNYKLLAKIDKDKKIDALIYKSDQEGKASYEINNKSFKEEAQKVIRNSLNRLQVTFLGVKIQVNHTTKTRDDENFSIDILDYETGIKAAILSIATMHLGSGGSLIYPSPHISCQKIYTVLKVEKDNLDEYIDRFVSLENLSDDPVLHLITFYTLYEYIYEGNKPFEALFSMDIDGKFKEVKRKSASPELVKLTFIDKFKATRDFIAHGILHGKPTLDILEQFLGSSSGEKALTFDRYNQSHINLINEVISEAQTVILNYLREELGVHKSS